MAILTCNKNMKIQIMTSNWSLASILKCALWALGAFQGSLGSPQGPLLRFGTVFGILFSCFFVFREYLGAVYGQIPYYNVKKQAAR